MLYNDFGLKIISRVYRFGTGKFTAYSLATGLPMSTLGRRVCYTVLSDTVFNAVFKNLN